MLHDCTFLPRSLCVLALLAAFFAPPAALADVHDEVRQMQRNGRPLDALARADRFLAENPRDPRMRFTRGVLLTEAGRTEEAIDAFVRMIADYPELPEPYNNLAVLYAGRSEFEKARDALQMAIRINPRYATAHENLGDVYAKLAVQSYVRAQEAGNASVQPKLGVIRELFPAPPAAGTPQSSAR